MRPGTYPRTDKHKAISRELIAYAHRALADPEIKDRTAEKKSESMKRFCATHPEQGIRGARLTWNKPRTVKQMDNIRRAQKLCHTPEQLRKASENLIRVRRNLRHNNVSKVQRDFYSLLLKDFPHLQLEYPVGIYNLDIADADSWKAIEVDGAYWHDKAVDEARDEHLATIGWRILRLDARRKTLFADETVSTALRFLRDDKNVLALSERKQG